MTVRCAACGHAADLDDGTTAAEWSVAHRCDPTRVQAQARAILSTIEPDPPETIARRRRLALNPE